MAWVFTVQVPHKISVGDVEALRLLFDVIAMGQLAELRGINFTYPKIPKCDAWKPPVSSNDDDAIDMTAKAKAEVSQGVWMAAAWASCDKPCGGGFSTRDVTCISIDGRQVSKLKCDRTNTPTKVKTCNYNAC